MELYDAMSTLRAVRRLKPDPVPEAVLARVLQAAAWAPTGGNVQPFRIVVVQEAALKQKIGAWYHDEWHRYSEGHRAALATLPEAAAVSTAKMLKAGDFLADHMGEAPALLVFCFNPAAMAITDANLDRPSVVGGGSVYTAVQNVLLACRQEGLGCVLTTLLCLREPEVKSLLDIPDGWGTCAHIPIGYPRLKGHGPISRRPIGKLAYRDHWGDEWQAG
ncbi:MAG: nitroreductase family protein [Pseudomonadota bacterium]